MKRILVPTDGSDCSALALDRALELAQKFDSEIILLHVEEPVADPQFVVGANFSGIGTTGLGGAALQTHPEPDAEAETPDDMDANPAPVDDFILQDAAERCLARNVRHTVSHLVGRPADAILATADSAQVDLIVMGSHGMGGFRRFFFGSVTHKVALSTHKSILIVR